MGITDYEVSGDVGAFNLFYFFNAMSPFSDLPFGNFQLNFHESEQLEVN